jgi:hypothetical protein
MKNKGLIIGGVGIIVASVLGIGGAQALAFFKDPINKPLELVVVEPEVQELEQEIIEQEIIEEEIVDEEPVKVVPEVDNQDDVEQPTALLTVIEDEVFYLDLFEGEHVLIEEDTMIVKQYDCLRAGKEGLAEIEFSPDVTLNMEPNSEICITIFENNDDESEQAPDINLVVEVSIGTIFFQKNDEELNWDIKVTTPTTVTYSDDDIYSFEVSTIFPGTVGMTPEELEEFIINTFALTPKEVCETEDGENFICDGCVTCFYLTENNPIKSVVIDQTGEIKVVYPLVPDGFVTDVLKASEMFIFEFEGYEDGDLWKLLCSVVRDIAKGEEVDENDIKKLMDPLKPEPPIVTPVSPCGDGVCDIYGGENATNCPADCD